jgi:DNA-binding GntR family transcriptional regulator
MIRPKLRDNAYNLLRNMILTLEFVPGGRVREDFIAESLSMSRTPVREAIERLVSEGLIKSIPRKGLFVIELTSERIRELIDVCSALEQLASSKCIENISEDGLIQIEEILQSMEKSLAAGDHKTCDALDSAFHRKITEFSGNLNLIQFLKEIEDLMQIVRALEKLNFARQKVEKSLRQHRRIYEAIKAGNRIEAGKALSQHFEQLRSNLRLKEK